MPLLRACLLLSLLGMGACDGGPEELAPPASVAALVATDSELQQFSSALEAAELTTTLEGPGPFTVFAPNDVAFTYLGASTLAAYFDPANRALLQRILRYHVVPGRVTAASLADGAELETLDGTTLTVRREGATIRIGEATLVEADLEAGNGLVHQISDVLRDNLDTDERLRLTPILSTYAALAEDTGTLELLGGEAPYTLFAPIEDAFVRFGSSALDLLTRPENADILARVIDHHVAAGRIDLDALASGASISTEDGTSLTLTREGGSLFLAGRRVLSAPTPTANGVLYLVEGLLLDNLALYEQLRIRPDLSSYQREIQNRSELTALLEDPNDYTVFAPVNLAFVNLPIGVLDALQQPSNAALFDRLMRVHIVPGRYRLEDLTNGLVLTALDGTELPVLRNGSDVFVGFRGLVDSGVEASNGVLHRLGSFLTPDVDALDLSLLRGATTYVEAVRNAGLESSFRDPGPLTLFALSNEVFLDDPNLFFDAGLEAILRYHAAAAALAPPPDSLVFTTLQGSDRTLYATQMGLFLDALAATFSLGEASNGWLYTVDTLIRPPSP